MKKLVIFDMDGVLIDSNHAWYVMFHSALKHFEKKSISKKEFDKKVWAKSIDITIRKYFSCTNKTLFQYFHSIRQKFVKEVVIFDGVHLLLKRLKNKYKIAVATNTNHRLAKHVLENLNIMQYIDYLVAGDDVKHGKPDPEMLLKVLKNFRLEKEDAIYVGDTIWDKIAAKKVGIYFVGVKIKGDKSIDQVSNLDKLL